VNRHARDGVEGLDLVKNRPLQRAFRRSQSTNPDVRRNRGRFLFCRRPNVGLGPRDYNWRRGGSPFRTNSPRRNSRPLSEQPPRKFSIWSSSLLRRRTSKRARSFGSPRFTLYILSGKISAQCPLLFPERRCKFAK